MHLLDNPVLQRELLVNLRMNRAFVLLFLYIAMLGMVVFAAWPSDRRLDLTEGGQQSVSASDSPPGVRLVNMFFLGQYILMALMTPSFAAVSIAGEKERKTYEMLLASPMHPRAIVLGKLLASLAYLGVLVFASLPIVMLCLPLGGMSLWEVFATYVAMAASIAVFGMISITASGYFTRSVAALLVSYMVILPMALLGVLFYWLFEAAAIFRLAMMLLVFPTVCATVCVLLGREVSRRLLHPPDVGSNAREVVDVEREQRAAVGMVIRSDRFPDRLFAPAKREELMDDGANPVYDKEMRSELFSQGTLMLRLVIQLSMILALPLMAVFLYIVPRLAPLYTGYVLLFNMLVGPVFSAGAVTGERERQTLELLLTTTLSPWQILSAKLYAGLRVSCVLTSFLVWPLLLAWVLPPWYFLQNAENAATMICYLAVIAISSVTTGVLGFFASVFFRKTTISTMAAYVAVIVLFAVPPAAKLFADVFALGSPAAVWIGNLTFLSPFGAVFSLPLTFESSAAVAATAAAGNAPNIAVAAPSPFVSFAAAGGFMLFYVILNVALLWTIIRLFAVRWRVAQ